MDGQYVIVRGMTSQDTTQVYAFNNFGVYELYITAYEHKCEACPANSQSPFSNTLKLISTCKCNTGYTGPDGGPCTACVPGKFKNIIGSSVCTDCTAGTYSNVPAASNASVCITCAAGVYSLAGASVCTNCSAGTFSTTTGATTSAACANCSAGTYSGISGASAASACVSCPSNTFSGAGAASCKPCQANATSGVGSVSQEFCYCKSGYAHAVGMLTCRICDPGTYNSQLGQTACSNCSVGLYSVHFGAIGNETCLACPLGQWSPEGSPSCNLCPANSRAAASSGFLVNCTCDAGFSGPNGGACTVCAAGKYKTVTGASPCESCAAGEYSNATGATSVGVCA